MTEQEARDRAVQHWLRKSADASESAQSELRAGRYDFAVNRAYYAAFYSASAVLLAQGRHFVKHTGVRAAIHLRSVQSETPTELPQQEMLRAVRARPRPVQFWLEKSKV